MVKGFCREDSLSTPQLTVPVSVPHTCFKADLLSQNAKLTACMCLANITFYFLLCIGEYTKPWFIVWNRKKIRATHTIQTSVGNVSFFKDGKIIPITSPLDLLLSSDTATLTISNQNNGRMGEMIHHQATKKDGCPITALAHWVPHIISNKGS